MKKLLILLPFIFLNTLFSDDIHISISHSTFYIEEFSLNNVEYLGLKEHETFDLIVFKTKDSPNIYSINKDYVQQIFINNEDANYLLYDSKFKYLDIVKIKYDDNSSSIYELKNIDEIKSLLNKEIMQIVDKNKKRNIKISPIMFALSAITHQAILNTTDIDTAEKLHEAEGALLFLGAMMLARDLNKIEKGEK